MTLGLFFSTKGLFLGCVISKSFWKGKTKGKTSGIHPLPWKSRWSCNSNLAGRWSNCCSSHNSSLPCQDHINRRGKTRMKRTKKDNRGSQTSSDCKFIKPIWNFAKHALWPVVIRTDGFGLLVLGFLLHFCCSHPLLVLRKNITNWLQLRWLNIPVVSFCRHDPLKLIQIAQ